MLRHLFNILWNERKNNLLVWVEMLVIVLCSLYLVDYLVVNLRLKNLPMGCDIHNVHRFYVANIPPESADYSPADSASQNEDIKAILRRIEAHPAVEAVSISHNSLPHQGSNNSMPVTFDTMQLQSVLVRTVTPSFLQVLRVNGLNGSREEMMEALRQGEIIPSEGLIKRFGRPLDSMVGKTLLLDRDSTNATVHYIAETMRVDNFWVWNTSFFTYDAEVFENELAEYAPYLEFAFRLKDEATLSADALFAELQEQMHAGNVYVSRFESVESTKKIFQNEEYNKLRMRILYTLFLGICIFLGIVGTFWYRSQQRRSQIGLRLAMGETPRHLLGFYLTEGVLLLLLTLPFALAGFFALKHFNILDQYWTEFWWRMPLDFVLTYGLLALLLIVAIWLPTRSAVHTAPSIAMRDE